MNFLQHKNIAFLSLCFAFFCGCTEEIVIDVEEGPRMVGIYGSITNEMKRHQIIVSQSSDFYGSGEPQMVSGAEVTVTEDDSIVHTFVETTPGIYEMSAPMRGEEGHIYQLRVTTHEEGRTEEYYAVDTMRTAITSIDSMRVLPRTFNNKKIEDRYKVCPYFQTLEGDRSSYLMKVAINGKLITDTLTEYQTMQPRNLSGVYLNGKEMETMFRGTDFPEGVYSINTKKDDEGLKAGDEVTLYVNVISKEYLDYIKDIKGSSGSNPFFGSPANVSSNIQPEKRALGFFFTSAITQGITIVRAEDLE